jgi:uncharacterized protein YmfQ (DUF2313 family)
VTGRFSPGFERYGGAGGGIKTILDGLNAARGTALNTEEDGIVYAENEGIARMLWIGWEQNARFALQLDPLRMTDTLSRWERIFGLTPLDTDTDVERRAAVAAKWHRIGVVPTRQQLIDRLRAALGGMFVAYETTSIADAIQWWPGGTPNVNAPWYSTTAHLNVRVARPASMPLGEFWTRLGSIHGILDDLAPTWVTWDWYVESPTGSGFFLDEENNLDHYRFD